MNFLSDFLVEGSKERYKEGRLTGASTCSLVSVGSIIQILNPRPKETSLPGALDHLNEASFETCFKKRKRINSSL